MPAAPSRPNNAVTGQNRYLALGYLGVLLLALLMLYLPPVQHWEARWRDQGFRWLEQFAPTEARDGIVIVGVDDEDLKGFGVPAAMMHRELGAFLEAMALAKPRLLGLDVLLPAASFDRLQPGLDAALARGIVTAGTVAPLVLGISTDVHGRPRALHPLFAALAGRNGTGFVLVLRDEDGMVRRFDERLGLGGENVPTLVGQLARASGLKPSHGLINYAVGTGYDYLPMRQVIGWYQQRDQARLQQELGGRIVLLGSVLAYDDQHGTPVRLGRWTSPESETSHGVLVLAQQLRSLLADRLIHPIAAPLQWLLLALLACSWWLPPRLSSWLLVAALVMLASVASMMGLREGWAAPSLAMGVALLGGVGARGAASGWLASRERRRLRGAFGGFVSPNVLQEILAGRLEPELGGTRADICVLFADIRGFTTLSEDQSPERVTQLLNRYFDRMATAIHRHEGTLDKFIGDGIMAVFGTPQRTSNPCQDAFNAACEMLAELKVFNREQVERGEAPIAIGIGLHFGPAIVGYVGSRDRYEYSAIGDTVNVAARIEGLTKELGFPVLLSITVEQNLAIAPPRTRVGAVPLKGRSPIELFGWKPHPEA